MYTKAEILDGLYDSVIAFTGGIGETVAPGIVDIGQVVFYSLYSTADDVRAGGFESSDPDIQLFRFRCKVMAIMHDLMEVLEHGISVLEFRRASQCGEDTRGDVISFGTPFYGLVVKCGLETLVKAFQIVIFRFFLIGQEFVLLLDPSGVHGLVKAVGDMEVVQTDRSVREAVFRKVQVGFSGSPRNTVINPREPNKYKGCGDVGSDFP